MNHLQKLYNALKLVFILAKKPFEKALRSFETFVLVNNNLYGKLFSSLESPTTFDESFKVTSVPFFSPDFNFKLRIRQFYVWNFILSQFIMIL